MIGQPSVGEEGRLRFVSNNSRSAFIAEEVDVSFTPSLHFHILILHGRVRAATALSFCPSLSCMFYIYILNLFFSFFDIYKIIGQDLCECVLEHLTSHVACDSV